jgi:hypothetical protein
MQQAHLNTTKSAPANAIPGRLAGSVSSVITPSDEGAAPHVWLGQEGQRQDSGQTEPKELGLAETPQRGVQQQDPN